MNNNTARAMFNKSSHILRCLAANISVRGSMQCRDRNRKITISAESEAKNETRAYTKVTQEGWLENMKAKTLSNFTSDNHMTVPVH